MQWDVHLAVWWALRREGVDIISQVLLRTRADSMLWAMRCLVVPPPTGLVRVVRLKDAADRPERLHAARLVTLYVDGRGELGCQVEASA